MKVLVTGATGLIGSETVTHLHEMGHDVIATGRKQTPDIPVPITHADLLDIATLDHLFEGVEAVVHLANVCGWSVPDIREGWLANLTIHGNVFEAARRAGCKRIVFASSVHSTSGIMTDGELLEGVKPAYLPLDENIPPIHCNPYGSSKIAAENILEYLTYCHGMTTISARIPLVVSEQRMPDMLAGKCGYKYARNDGFAYLAPDDMASFFNAAITADITGHHVFFTASKENMLRKPVHEVIDEHYADVPLRMAREEIVSLVDLRKPKELLGWEPKR